ncbi:MAG: redoxin domain-containing protein, partial [Fimbriimonadales bacterium]|nr:redoxin domain-containing protein [Fimbriimonadales bacterium]
MRAVWMLGLLSGLGALSWNAALVSDNRIVDAKVSLKHRVLTEAPKSGAVNRRVSDLEFSDLQGRVYILSQLVRQGPVVFLFTATKCPAAQRYTVRINQLYEAYRKKGVQLFLVYPNYDDTRESVLAHRREYGLKPPVIHDSEGVLARAVGATMTPQAVLIDKKMLLRYRGAIDDNRYENRVRVHYLKDALNAVLAGKPVKVAAAETFGCTIRFREEVASEAPITYAKHIAPIMQAYCQPCHRPGEVAPFSLMTYRDAYTWRKEIAKVVEARQMPPWKPVHGYGEFQGERRLTDEQIGMILKWVESGAPMGDPKDLPPPKQFSNGWKLGEPDIVLEMPVEYEVGPTGDDEYRHFVIPTNFDRDVFVR